jgi:hypothetical protein
MSTSNKAKRSRRKRREGVVAKPFHAAAQQCANPPKLVSSSRID